MLSPGQTVDRYTVESVIGHGGTAVVYLVRHNQLGSQHALKVLSLTSGAIRERLLREGRVQASIQHVNIVTVTDVLDVGGSPGLLMEHIDGPALDGAMRRYKIGLRDALVLFRGVVAGVRAAHRHGLVHRDLKPANVLLFRSPEGFVPKVTDFGLAKVVAGEGADLGQTRQGIAMGTPAYMAPEQIRDAARVDQRADIFSLGCILYELATRQRAFPGDQALEIYNNIVAGRYVPPQDVAPDLPPEVVNAIDGCLALERDARIPDCDTLLDVLAGRRLWVVQDHPVPDEVLPTDEVPRDAPDMHVARGKLTPASAPGRVAGPELGERDIDAVVQSDGTLGGDTSLVPDEEAPPRRVPTWVLAAVASLFAAVLAAFVVIGASVLLLWSGDTSVSSAASTVEPPPPGEGPTPAEPTSPSAPTSPPSETPVVPSTEARPPAPPRPTAPSVREPASPPRPAPVTAYEVKLLSVPRTVEVQVDGVAQGRTPKKLSLTRGTHRIELRSGDQDGAFTIEVADDLDNTWCYVFEAGRPNRGQCP